MMEAVHRYEGTVNQVMGDGIMALFGAPLALEDHALRACYAALAIQNSMRTYGEEARREQGVEVHARVGLNSGEVVVRTIGNDLKMDYSAIGQTTHLASRMEQMAASGTVRLTGSTLRLAEGFVQVESLGPVPIIGIYCAELCAAALLHVIGAVSLARLASSTIFIVGVGAASLSWALWRAYRRQRACADNDCPSLRAVGLTAIIAVVAFVVDMAL